MFERRMKPDNIHIRKQRLEKLNNSASQIKLDNAFIVF